MVKSEIGLKCTFPTSRKTSYHETERATSSNVAPSCSENRVEIQHSHKMCPNGFEPCPTSYSGTSASGLGVMALRHGFEIVRFMKLSVWYSLIATGTETETCDGHRACETHAQERVLHSETVHHSLPMQAKLKRYGSLLREASRFTTTIDIGSLDRMGTRQESRDDKDKRPLLIEFRNAIHREPQCCLFIWLLIRSYSPYSPRASPSSPSCPSCRPWIPGLLSPWPAFAPG